MLEVIFKVLETNFKVPKAISKLLKSISKVLKSIFKVLKVEITKIQSVPFVSQVIRARTVRRAVTVCTSRLMVLSAMMPAYVRTPNLLPSRSIRGMRAFLHGVPGRLMVAMLAAAAGHGERSRSRLLSHTESHAHI